MHPDCHVIFVANQEQSLKNICGCTGVHIYFNVLYDTAWGCTLRVCWLNQNGAPMWAINSTVNYKCAPWGGPHSPLRGYRHFVLRRAFWDRKGGITKAPPCSLISAQIRNLVVFFSGKHAWSRCQYCVLVLTIKAISWKVIYSKTKPFIVLFTSDLALQHAVQHKRLPWLQHSADKWRQMSLVTVDNIIRQRTLLIINFTFIYLCIRQVAALETCATVELELNT